MSQSIPTGYIPPANPRRFAQKNCPGKSRFDFWKVSRGPRVRHGLGFCGKFKLCLTPYKCVLRRRFVFLVFNNFSETPCMKAGLDQPRPQGICCLSALFRVMRFISSRNTNGPENQVGFGCEDFTRQGSIYWGEAPPPPKKKLFLKKIKSYFKY